LLSLVSVGSWPGIGPPLRQIATPKFADRRGLVGRLRVASGLGWAGVYALD